MKKLTVAFLLICSLLCIVLVGCNKKEKECEHEFGDWKVVTEAVKCKTPGLKQKKCTKCGYVMEESVSEHAFGEWVKLSESTCSEKGSREHTCKDCGFVATESIDPLPHTYGEWTVETKPSCTEMGLRSRTCLVCSERDEEDVPAGHTYGDWDVIRESTCEEVGLRARTCSVCKEKVREAIPKHRYGELTVLKEAVPCNGESGKGKNGSAQQTCLDCGHVEKVTLYAHDYDDGRLTKSATCDEDGSKTRFCTACKDRLVEELPAFGHDPSEPRIVAASCEKDGSEKQTCLLCKKTILSVTIPALGHSFDANGVCVNNLGTEEAPKECGAKCESPLKFEAQNDSYVVTGMKGSATTVVIPLDYMGLPVVGIADSAFAGTKVKVVTITGNISSIGKEAFKGCTSLKTLTIGASVTTIGDGAFADCTGLKNVTLPKSVKTVGKEILKGCTGLTTLSVPFIGATADEKKTDTLFLGYFFGASSYKTQGVAVPEGEAATPNAEVKMVTPVPASLKTVLVTGGTKIADYAFYGCENLTGVMLSKSIQSVGTGAFNFCATSDSIKIENKLIKIYFEGTKKEFIEWNRRVNFMYTLDSRGLYLYSANEPTEEGNYWYFDGATLKTWEKT